MRECDRAVLIGHLQLKGFLWCDEGGRVRESLARAVQKVKSLISPSVRPAKISSLCPHWISRLRHQHKAVLDMGE